MAGSYGALKEGMLSRLETAYKEELERTISDMEFSATALSNRLRQQNGLPKAAADAMAIMSAYPPFLGGIARAAYLSQLYVSLGADGLEDGQLSALGTYLDMGDEFAETMRFLQEGMIEAGNSSQMDAMESFQKLAGHIADAERFAFSRSEAERARLLDLIGQRIASESIKLAKSGYTAGPDGSGGAPPDYESLSTLPERMMRAAEAVLILPAPAITRGDFEATVERGLLKYSKVAGFSESFERVYEGLSGELASPLMGAAAAAAGGGDFSAGGRQAKASDVKLFNPLPLLKTQTGARAGGYPEPLENTAGRDAYAKLWLSQGVAEKVAALGPAAEPLMGIRAGVTVKEASQPGAPKEYKDALSEARAAAAAAARQIQVFESFDGLQRQQKDRLFAAAAVYSILDHLAGFASDCSRRLTELQEGAHTEGMEGLLAEDAQMTVLKSINAINDLTQMIVSLGNNPDAMDVSAKSVELERFGIDLGAGLSLLYGWKLSESAPILIEPGLKDWGMRIGNAKVFPQWAIRSIRRYCEIMPPIDDFSDEADRLIDKALSGMRGAGPQDGKTL